MFHKFARHRRSQNFADLFVKEGRRGSKPRIGFVDFRKPTLSGLHNAGLFCKGRQWKWKNSESRSSQMLNPNTTSYLSNNTMFTDGYTYHIQVYSIDAAGNFSTTMSTFAFETVNMASVGELALAGVSVLLNVGASLGAIILGRAVVTLLLGLG